MSRIRIKWRLKWKATEGETAAMGLAPSEMFRVLGVASRIAIINLLKTRGALGTKEIAGLVGITPAAVSQHLRVLRQAGLVQNQRHGYWVPYSLDADALECCRRVLNEVCTCGCRPSRSSRGRPGKNATREALTTYRRKLEKELRRVREQLKHNAQSNG